MRKKLTICTNCEQKSAEGFQFCPHCGLKFNEELTIGVLFYNTISNYFSVDARFFKSFIPLLIKPGFLAKTFIQGKRLLYLHPAQMYLFVSVVFFFLFSFISRKQVESVDKVFKDDLKKTSLKLDSINKNDAQFNDINFDSIVKSNEVKGVNRKITYNFNQTKVDSLIQLNASNETIYKAMGMPEDAGFFKRKAYSQMLKFYKQRNGGSLLQGFYDSIPVAMFILLPIFALILKLLYYKKGPFSYHLVFSFYFFSFLFMAFGILIATNFIIKLPDSLVTIAILSTFFYLLIAVKRFYEQRWFLSFIKTSIATFSFLLLVIPLAIIVLSLATFMFY
ncbi:DUF3667 domain-containing protein [Mariniflexile jejuense]|uniref:DUF3667 domain-containing protein n=1 Tax=Mariniflexile jejuense TaxID=1173582 RepID=A0ABW3JED6_9FLAO